MPPKKMEAEVSALESEVANLKVTLAEMRAQAAADQERLVCLLTQSKDTGGSEEMDKIIQDEDSSNSGSFDMQWLLQKLHGGALDEFRQPVKKVEFPLFNGEDPLDCSCWDLFSCPEHLHKT